MHTIETISCIGWTTNRLLCDWGLYTTKVVKNVIPMARLDDGIMMNRHEKARVAAEVQVSVKRRRHLARVCNPALTQR